MAKYSLWVSDRLCNKVCVPLSRDGKTFSKKVELYEIDLLTISLGKEQFIQSLKQSNVFPNNFDWNSINAYITYSSNGKERYLPLIFEKIEILINMINVQNTYRYHYKLSEAKLVEEMTSPNAPFDLALMKSRLQKYRDSLLRQISSHPEFLDNQNIPKNMAQKMYSCSKSYDYDEQIEYKNDILKNMMSYLNFRRLIAAQYGCHLNQRLASSQFIEEEEEVEERDPDEEAFLTEEEQKMMYG